MAEKLIHSIISSDWFLLIVIPIMVNIINFFINCIIYYCIYLRQWLISDLNTTALILTWMSSTIFITLIALFINNKFSPELIGSGIKQIKFLLYNYHYDKRHPFTWKILYTKILTLILLGASGLPLGIQTPMVQICAILIHLIFSLIGFNYNNNNNQTQELVNILSIVTLSIITKSLIGGILFASEMLSSSSISIRVYYRALYSSTISFILTYLLDYLYDKFDHPSHQHHLLYHSHQHHFINYLTENSFTLVYIIIFIFIGLISSLMGIIFIKIYYTSCKIHPFIEPLHIPFVLFLSSFISLPLYLGYYYPSNLTMESMFNFYNNDDIWNKCIMIQANVTSLSSSIQSLSLASSTFLITNNNNNFIMNSSLNNSVYHLCVSSYNYINLIVFISLHFILIPMCFHLPLSFGELYPLFTLGTSLGRLLQNIIIIIYPYEDIIYLPYTMASLSSFISTVLGPASSLIIAIEYNNGKHWFLIIISTLISLLVKNFIKLSSIDLHNKLDDDLKKNREKRKKIQHNYKNIKNHSNYNYNNQDNYYNIDNNNNDNNYYHKNYNNINILSFINYDISSWCHKKTLGQIMITDILYIWNGCTYRYIKHLITFTKSLDYYPYVSSPGMNLIGTINKEQIKLLLENVNVNSKMLVSSSSRLSNDTKDTSRLNSKGNKYNNVKLKFIQENNDYLFMNEFKSFNSIDNEDEEDDNEDANDDRENDEKEEVEEEEQEEQEQDDDDDDYDDKINKRKNDQNNKLLHNNIEERLSMQKKIMIRLNTTQKSLLMRTQKWENKKLNEPVDFSNCVIEPVPVQLSADISILQARDIFVLLGLNISYVTSLGRLIGVVSLKELNEAIQKMEK